MRISCHDSFIEHSFIFTYNALQSVIKVVYPISSVFLHKQSPKSRSILDGSRSSGWFRKGKTRIVAKFHKVHLVICSHSIEGKIPSYSRINMVYIIPCWRYIASKDGFQENQQN